VYEGEHACTKDNNSLGMFELALSISTPTVFLLNVSAADKTIGKLKHIIITISCESVTDCHRYVWAADCAKLVGFCDDTVFSSEGKSSLTSFFYWGYVNVE
jgi:hypothetical protein